MRRFAEEILSKIDVEIRLKNCDVNLVMDNALYMVKFIAPMYERLREMVISYSFPSVEDEIYFFKEYCSLCCANTCKRVLAFSSLPKKVLRTFSAVT